ncbi:MAG: hypothetical protein K9L25_11350 [Methylovulum sp.]|nr:hypothetical protein [Methylovulum sp.]
MMNQSYNDIILKKIQDEMFFIWYYLSAYTELYGHHDINRAKVIEATAPAFFDIVYSSLTENILLRIARLLDNPKMGSNTNLSFGRLFQSNCADKKYDDILCIYCKVKRAWEKGKYKELKNYRDDILAHNDLKTKRNDSSRNLPFLDKVKTKLIDELFQPRTPHTNYVGCISVSVMHQNLLWCLMGDEFHVSWHGYGG